MIWVRAWLRILGMDSSFGSVQASVVVVGDDDDDSRAAAMMMIIGDDEGTGGSAADEDVWVMVGGSRALCAACLARQGPAFACSSVQVGFVMIVHVSNAAQGQQQSSSWGVV